MARPRKITTELMIEIVDSYYLNRSGGNEKLMKCSLIAAYANELGYSAEGYDSARNLERAYRVFESLCGNKQDVYGVKYQPSPSYKNS